MLFNLFFCILNIHRREPEIPSSVFIFQKYSIIVFVVDLCGLLINKFPYSFDTLCVKFIPVLRDTYTSYWSFTKSPRVRLLRPYKHSNRGLIFQPQNTFSCLFCLKLMDLFFNHRTHPAVCFAWNGYLTPVLKSGDLFRILNKELQNLFLSSVFDNPGHKVKDPWEINQNNPLVAVLHTFCSYVILFSLQMNNKYIFAGSHM